MSIAAEFHDAYPSRAKPRPLVSPRLDPVVWGVAEGPLGRHALARYEAQGFLVLPQLFGKSELDDIRVRADTALAAATPDGETVVAEPDSHEVRSIFAIHERDPVIGRLLADRRLADIARQILGGGVYIHQSRLNYKPAFDGREFWWHSDFETWHIEDGMPRMRALSMSLLLTDNSASNGPLLLIAGSHRYYVACVGATPEDHYKHSLRKQEYGVPDKDSIQALAARDGVHAVLAPAGSVVIFDCNILHGSVGNISPLPRSNLFFVYNSVDNRCTAPFGGRAPRPHFIANRTHFDPI